MTWVRYTVRPEQGHECQPPMRERVFTLPASITGGKTAQHVTRIPDGAWGDLWRCDCGSLWRIGNACDNCDRLGRNDGSCTAGWHHVTEAGWRPATWWQRVRNRRAGWDPRAEDPAVTARLEAEKERP